MAAILVAIFFAVMMWGHNRKANTYVLQYTRRDSSIILASRVDFEHFPRKKNKKLARKIREFRMNFARNFVASRGTFPRYARAWRGNFTCGGKSSRVDGTKITWNLKYVLTQ